jgi:hypothetical protein
MSDKYAGTPGNVASRRMLESQGVKLTTLGSDKKYHL